MKLSKFPPALLLCLFLLTAWGCATANADLTQSAEYQTNPLDIADVKSVKPSPKFAINLFQQVTQGQEKNVFLSPASVELALAMLYNGADGQTKSQMTNLLLPRPLPLAIFNQQNAELIKSLTTDPAVKLQIANSVWSRQDVSFQTSFLERVRNSYQAFLASRNFSDPQLPSEINQWVSKQTEGKIPKIIDSINRDDVMFLINAVYFKGDWARKFEPSLTTNQPFFLVNGKQKQVPMMFQSGEFAYFESDRFQSVNLPYGKGRFSMYVILPKPNQKLASLVSSLTVENWDLWTRSFRPREGAIELPKFKLEYEINLNQALQRMGMQDAFRRDRANFKLLTSNPVFVNLVKHKTYVDVSEAGTEAAGVTSIGIRTTSVPVPTNPFNLRVDRPFLTVIRDNQTGTLLFMGAIYEP